MTLLVDTSALVAQADRSCGRQTGVAGCLERETGVLVVPVYVVTETDSMISSRFGCDADLAFLDDIAAGTYQVELLTPSEHAAARDLVARYRDLEIGLADASLVVLARRLGTRRILTLEERHFRAMEPLQGGHFTILPADA